MEPNRADRHHLGGEIAAKDKKTKITIGYLCDLSATGIMLIGEEAPAKNKEYHLTIELSEEEGGPFEVTATCKWVKMGDVEDSFESGFVLEKPDANILDRMSNISQTHNFFGNIGELPPE